MLLTSVAAAAGRLSSRAPAPRSASAGPLGGRQINGSVGLARPGAALSAGHRQRRRATRCEATSEAASTSSPDAAGAGAGAFTAVLRLADLPKGTRQTVRVAGKNILLFWYRDEIYAVEARSPAEGAFSEGFAAARFTQDGCIECPTTKSTFNLKTGAIVQWYTGNPVMAMLTPRDTCRPMEVFPVRCDPDTIYVDGVNSNLAGAGNASAEETAGGYTYSEATGGALTSIERNNVYGIEPKVYLEGSLPTAYLSEEANPAGVSKVQVAPVTIVTTVIAVAASAMAGTAVAIYYENVILLAVLWITGFTLAAIAVANYLKAEESSD